MASLPAYRRRRPEETALHRALERGVGEFFAQAQEAGREVPAFVERELRGYLRCGRLEFGFAHVKCPACGYDRLVGFSCKGRGFCPSCCGRRMADTAAHLVDHVLPDTPYRQWVLSVPPPLRYLLAYDGELLSKVLGFFVVAIASWQRGEAKRRYGLARLCDMHTGAVAVIQRFGSALELNPHIHVLAPDGVFVAHEGEGPVRFLKLGTPNLGEVRSVGWETCTKTIALLRKQGRWFDAESGDGDGIEDRLALDEPLLSEIYGASLQGTLAMGPNRGRRVIRLVELPPARGESRPRAAYGFDVHAGVHIDAGKTGALERLCKYLLRPPAATDRFEQREDGSISVRLKKAWSDGTTHVVLTPAELVERLVALVPPPRKNQIRYHGIFAPRHRLRARILPQVEATTTGSGERTDDCCRGSRMSWARLMKRVFDFEVLVCPRCDSAMQRIAFVTDPAAIKKILSSVGYAADSPAAAA